MTTTKTIANKVLKALKQTDQRGLFRIVEKNDDFICGQGLMIQNCFFTENNSNPMDHLVEFVQAGDFDYYLVWKKTGQKLTEQETQDYHSKTVYTAIPKDELKYEDFLFIYKGKDCLNVSGVGFAGIHLTSLDTDFPSDVLEHELGKMLPNKEVYIDDGSIEIWECL